MNEVIALFGQSQRGPRNALIFLPSLSEVYDSLGHGEEAIQWAIALALLGRKLLFFRVTEEGLNKEEYLAGLNLLSVYGRNLGALVLPGLSDLDIIGSARDVCKKQGGFLITQEKDFYDLSH